MNQRPIWFKRVIAMWWNLRRWRRRIRRRTKWLIWSVLSSICLGLVCTSHEQLFCAFLKDRRKEKRVFSFFRYKSLWKLVVKRKRQDWKFFSVFVCFFFWVYCFSKLLFLFSLLLWKTKRKGNAFQFFFSMEFQLYLFNRMFYRFGIHWKFYNIQKLSIIF